MREQVVQEDECPCSGGTERPYSAPMLHLQHNAPQAHLGAWRTEFSSQQDLFIPPFLGKTPIIRRSLDEVEIEVHAGCTCHVADILFLVSPCLTKDATNHQLHVPETSWLSALTPPSHFPPSMNILRQSSRPDFTC